MVLATPPPAEPNIVDVAPRRAQQLEIDDESYVNDNRSDTGYDSDDESFGILPILEDLQDSDSDSSDDEAFVAEIMQANVARHKANIARHIGDDCEKNM
jgi:hypothetical protein